MEWLLTLFAMLSAVSGAFNGVRGEETQLHRAEAASAVQIVAVAAQAAVVMILPTIPANAPFVAVLPAMTDAPHISGIPLYADRLIE
jgi:hypothetical protein